MCRELKPGGTTVRNVMSVVMLALALAVCACTPVRHAPAISGAAAVVARDYVIVIPQAGASGQPRMIRMKVRILFETAASDRRLQELGSVQESFRAYCRGFTADDLRGAEGMRRLKNGLLRQARAAAPDLDIWDIVFEEVLVL